MRRYPIGSLLTLGWPLVPAAPDMDPNMKSVIDGAEIVFAEATQRRLMAAFLRTAEGRAREGKAYVVFVPHGEWRRSRGHHFCTGWTAFTRNDSIHRYQSVVFETRFVRQQGTCAEGVFFEIDATHVSAWNGETLRPHDATLH